MACTNAIRKDVHRRHAMRGRARHGILVFLVGCALGLIAVESFLRLRQYRRYGTSAPTFYRFADDPASGLRIPEPGSEVGPIRVNAKGFRGPELEDPKPPGRLRIAFLGGSTTFCAEASRLETTWPYLVVAGLRRDHPEADFDYVNAAVGGFSTRESLVNLERRVAPLDPDVLFVYHATDDLTQDSRIAAREQRLWEPENQEPGFIGRHWITWFLIEKNLRSLRSRRRRGPKLEIDPTELAAPFRRRLDTLLDACESVAQVTVVGTFCHRVRREQSPAERETACASSLYYMPFLTPDDLLDAFEEYDRVIREVTAHHDVTLVELEDAIPPDSRHFNDSVHLKDPGLALLAERMLRGLEGTPAFQELLRAAAAPSPPSPASNGR